MSNAAPPAHTPVVVIGGGAMGCSTLYHLSKAGISDAILLERNQLTSGNTWHSAAQVRALRSSRNLTDLIRYSVALYSEHEAETGQATGWINKGSLSVATNPDRMAHIVRQAGLAGIYGVEAQVISAGEAKKRWPLMNAEDVIGAVWSPDDGRVSPSDLCAALIKGARIFENTGVTAILTGGGRVRGVETAHGNVTCDVIALCAGLWNREAGAEIRLWPCEHFYLLTKPVPGVEGNLATLGDHDGHLYIRDDSGGFLVGCFEPNARPISAARIGERFCLRPAARGLGSFRADDGERAAPPAGLGRGGGEDAAERPGMLHAGFQVPPGRDIPHPWSVPGLRHEFDGRRLLRRRWHGIGADHRRRPPSATASAGRSVSRSWTGPRTSNSPWRSPAYPSRPGSCTAPPSTRKGFGSGPAERRRAGPLHLAGNISGSGAAPQHRPAGPAPIRPAKCRAARPPRPRPGSPPARARPVGPSGPTGAPRRFRLRPPGGPPPEWPAHGLRNAREPCS